MKTVIEIYTRGDDDERITGMMIKKAKRSNQTLMSSHQKLSWGHLEFLEDEIIPKSA